MKNISQEFKLIFKDFRKRSKVVNEIELSFIPVEMDKYNKDINSLIEACLHLTESERKKINISEKIACMLVDFSFEMATYSLRYKEQSYFTHGLVAMGIAVDNVCDYRDVLVVLSLYWDVHKRANLSFQPALGMNDAFSKRLQYFIETNGSDFSLMYELVGEGLNAQYKSKKI